MKKLLAYVQLALLLIIAGFFGAYVGFLLGEHQAREASSEMLIGDFSEEISLLKLDTIENGVATGTLEGLEMRLVIGDEEVVSIFPGAVEIPLVHILPNLETIPSPEGSAFVASKNGKYYYPLDAPEAAMLSVDNRIFFVTEEEAWEKGYQPRK